MKQSATQFLAADRKGRLFLLRGDTLEVFRLNGKDFESVGKLACGRSPEGAYSAAMDLSGSTWAISPAPFRLDLCDFSQQRKTSGFTGMVSSLAFSSTGPLAAVVPIGLSRPDLARPMSARTPRVLGLEGSAWKAMSWALLPELNDSDVDVMTQVKAQTDCLICSGAKSAIWLASWNAYRLEKASSSETPSHELVVGKGQVRWLERTAEEQKDLNQGLEKQGLDPKKNRGGRFYPQNVIRALVCAQDGHVYLLVTTDKGLALDRFHPTQRTLDRIILEGVKVGGGPMTAAMTRDDLVFGGRFAQDGLWRVSLEDLATASWQPVPGARLNGKAI